MNLTALWDVSNQFNHKNGSILAGGKIYVFYEGRSQLATTYVDGAGQVVNPNPILLDNNGRATCFADDAYSYTCVVCDFYGKEQFSFNPVGLGGQSSTAITKYNITSDSLNVTSAYDASTNTKTFDIEIQNTNPQHWYGMYGASIQHDGSTIGITLPVPTNISYEGNFIDRIEDGKYIYLKEGIYLVDCVIRFEQDPEHLENKIEEVLVYTGNGNANEDQTFILDETGRYSYTADYRKCIKQSFVRIVKEGDTYSSNVLYFAPGFPVPCRDMFIQSLSIVKLENYVGSGGSTSGEVYKAGEHIVIDPYNVISTSGLVDVHDMSGYMRKDEYPTMDLVAGQGINIDVQNNSAFISASGFVTPTQLETALNSYVTEQTFNTNIQNINSGLSGKLDSSAYVSPVQSDWNQNDQDALDYIKNKPEIPSIEGLATEEYVLSQTSGKQDSLSFMYNSSGDIIGINNSAIAGGAGGGGMTYQAGEGIGIEGNVISVSGSYLQTSAYTAPVQSDWNQTNTSSLDYILNKPNTEEVQFEELDLTGLASQQYVDEHIVSATSGLQPAGDYVQQNDLSAYVTNNTFNQTINNIEADVSGKLDTSAYTAPVNADWNSSTGLSEILNKPSTEEVQFEELDLSIYAQKTELAGKLDTSAYVAPVNSDWNATSGLANILNKPNTEEVQFEELDLSSYATKTEVENGLSNKLDTSAYVAPHEYTAGQNIAIQNDEISVSGTATLVAGQNVTITPSGESYIISSTGGGGGATYSAGTGIAIDNNNVISVSGSYLQTSAYVAPVNADWNSSTGLSEILNKPNTEEVSFEELDLSTYASKTEVAGKLDSSAYVAPVNSDWNATSGLANILNKPNTEEVSFEELDLSSYASKTDLGNYQATSGMSAYQTVAGMSAYQTVAGMSGYAEKSDLEEKLDTSAYVSPVNADWNSSTGLSEILNKPNTEEVSFEELDLSTYAQKSDLGNYQPTSGMSNYAEKSEIAGKLDTSAYVAPVNSDWNATSGLAEILNKPNTEDVSFEELDLSDYVQQSDLSNYASKTDLAGKLDTSAYVAPVNSDWNSTSGISEILNKPNTEDISFEELDLSSYASKTDLGNYQPTSGMSAYQTVAGMSTYATDQELASAVSGKQNKLTSVNDVQLVNALPGSTVSTTLYLIPEA